MTFDHPLLLASLLAPVMAAKVYIVRQRRARKFTLLFTSLDLLDTVAPHRPGRARHLAFASAVLTGVLLAVAAAGPQVLLATERRVARMFLAIDVSLSMDATDVAPNRLAAAQAAADRFVRELPDDVELGLISFSDASRLLVAPTLDRTALIDAINRLALEPGTAIGEAVFTAIDQLAASGQDGAGAHVVVLSDGATTSGRSNEMAAFAATEAGVAVSTIAFGTGEGTVTVQGETIPVPVDEAALQELADATGGTAVMAESADALAAAFDTLERIAEPTTEPRAIAPSLALAGMITLAAAGSIWLASGTWVPPGDMVHDRTKPSRRASSVDRSPIARLEKVAPTSQSQPTRGGNHAAGM